MNRKSLLLLAVLALVAGMAAGCAIEPENDELDDLFVELDTSTEDDTDTSELDDALAIEGSYNDSWGATYEIGEEIWTIGYAGDTDVSAFTLTDYDNDLEYVIAQNDLENTWNGGLWSRFDWTFDGDDLYLCQSVYDGATEDDAASAEPADSADLDAGCDGFSWSLLTTIE